MSSSMDTEIANLLAAVSVLSPLIVGSVVYATRLESRVARIEQRLKDEGELVAKLYELLLKMSGQRG
jgi:hypothetical protein